MRVARFAAVVFSLAYASASDFGPKDAPNYMGIRSGELIRLIGLPAEITLETSDAPAQEIWWITWDDLNRRLNRANFQFCGNKVCGYVAAFDAKRLVSTETKVASFGFIATLSKSGKDSINRNTSNQSMKPTAPSRNNFSVFATTPCRGLSLSR